MIAARSRPAPSASASRKCSTATYSSFSASASENERSSASRSARLAVGDCWAPSIRGSAHLAGVRARLLQDARRDAALLVEQGHQQVVGGQLGIAPGDGVALGG
jgi:hypothetical protein